jgi:hypothetical protein
MKRGLGQSPLPPVHFIFAGQQSFAQQTLGPLQCETFMKARVMSDQNVLDVVRMIQEKRFLRTEAKVGNVAKLRREILKKRQRTFAVSEQA